MKKIVVLGSNSFSGQDFIDLLLDDPSLTIIGVSRSTEKNEFYLRYKKRKDLSRYRFFQMDMNRDMDRFLAMLDAERPDSIVNFAAQSEVAQSWEYPEHWFETNTVALSRFVNHMRRQSYLKRYLHVSSPEAYGSCEGKVTEETPDNPSTPYAASKSAADMLTSVYQNQYEFPVLWVRATNVYGARQQIFKIVPRTIVSLKFGKKLQLHGGGVAVKSYIHVRDVSIGELAILRNGRIGQRYHLAPDRGVAIKELVGMVAERMGQQFEDVVEIVEERPGQDGFYLLDSKKARTELKWNPLISLNEGIDETVRWVEENWAKIEREPLDYVHRK